MIGQAARAAVARSRVRVTLATAVACLALQGCILERVFDTHAQLCEAKPPQIAIVGTPAAGLRVVFERPTLSRADVEWLVGLPATRVEPTSDGVRLVYAARPSDAELAGNEELVTQLVFRTVGGVPRLAESIPPPRLSRLATRELVDRTIAAVCKPEISIAPPGARFDITGMGTAAFPDERRVVSILGPPHERLRDPDGLAYRYCLVPCDAGVRPLAEFRYALGADGKLARADFAYFRYRLVVEPAAGVATIALRL